MLTLVVRKGGICKLDELFVILQIRRSFYRWACMIGFVTVDYIFMNYLWIEYGWCDVWVNWKKNFQCVLCVLDKSFIKKIVYITRISSFWKFYNFILVNTIVNFFMRYINLKNISNLKFIKYPSDLLIYLLRNI